MTFKLHKHAQERTSSASALVQALIQAQGLVDQHRREFLGIALWKVTEAESRGKYNIRFQSEAARTAPREDKRHDHVFQRAKMVDDLLKAHTDEVEIIIAKAIGCVVTREEHTLLDRYKHLDGWDRYKKAGIAVYDTETGERVI